MTSKGYGRRLQATEYEYVKKEILEYILYSNIENVVVEGIILYLNLLDENINLSYDFLAKMTSLRYLKIHSRIWYLKNNVYLLEGLDLCSDKLEYFQWDNYCDSYFPSNFCVK
ncbi:hypothetical protein Fmac_003725 [Flemingia macrophylla]|uniref:Uncharacterized protein n=1 Tax=Flemingia macrophylla TaxID=520843 RepID=A0ABD1N5G7_9FABA